MIPQTKDHTLHYLYVDSSEYHRFEYPKSKIIPISIAGVHAIYFARLDEAISYRSANEGNFTFFDGDHPQVSNYWSYVRRHQDQIDPDARPFRTQDQ